MNSVVTPACFRFGMLLVFSLAAFFPCSLRADFATDVLALTNVERQKLNLSPLSLNPILNSAALSHAQDMAVNDYFSHTGRDGSSFSVRITRAGGTITGGGENIAAGFPTPAEVVAGWMNSPGHRENILNPAWNFMGLGYFFLATDSGASNFNHYWVQLFASGISGTGTTPVDPIPFEIEPETLDLEDDVEPIPFNPSTQHVFTTPGAFFGYTVALPKEVDFFRCNSGFPEGLQFHKESATIYGRIRDLGTYRVNLLVAYTDGSWEQVPLIFRVRAE